MERQHRSKYNCNCCFCIIIILSRLFIVSKQCTGPGTSSIGLEYVSQCLVNQSWCFTGTYMGIVLACGYSVFVFEAVFNLRALSDIARPPSSGRPPGRRPAGRRHGPNGPIGPMGPTWGSMGAHRNKQHKVLSTNPSTTKVRVHTAVLPAISTGH